MTEVPQEFTAAQCGWLLIDSTNGVEVWEAPSGQRVAHNRRANGELKLVRRTDRWIVSPKGWRIQFPTLDEGDDI